MDQDSDSTESHASDDESDSARGSKADKDDVTEGFSDHKLDKDNY